jgi:hypothetical protein
MTYNKCSWENVVKQTEKRTYTKACLRAHPRHLARAMQRIVYTALTGLTIRILLTDEDESYQILTLTIETPAVNCASTAYTHLEQRETQNETC